MTHPLTSHMAFVEDRSKDGDGFYRRLVENVGGVRSAAIVDLIIDGSYSYLDLRRQPFAGNEALKALAREASAAHAALRDELIQLGWKTAADDEGDDT